MSLRVLLADESASIRKVFQMGLQDYGAEVKSVHNGLDVVEVAQNFEPHIIFADILLQKKNGYEVAQEISQHHSLSLTPVVLMWSSFMELDQGKYKTCGAKAELEKPFDVDQMRQLIKNLVETTKSQHLAEFLTFPNSITADFVEEEKQKEAGAWTPPSPAPDRAEAADDTPDVIIPPPPEPTPAPAATNFEVSELQAESFALEGEDTPPLPDMEITSEFNIQATQGEEFSMYEVPPSPLPKISEAEDALFSAGDDKWEAKPLNDMTKTHTPSQAREDDSEQFQSMDLGQEKKLNLEDFLYQPNTNGPQPRDEEPSSELVRTGEIHNVQVPNYDNQTQPISVGISSEEQEAIIRQEVRLALQKVITEQLPAVLEKVVREELEKILRQEMELKNPESPR